MKKKIALAIFAVAVTISVLPVLYAFEAHIINVTATIENALFVPLKELEFGTVFPQEQLEEPLTVELSQSFQTDDRVDDVEYVLRQKPKCGLPVPDTNPVEYSEFSLATEDENGNFVCDEQGHVILPLLCPYLSKHSEIIGENQNGPIYEDGALDSFHGPIENWDLTHTINFELPGYLAKSAEDLSDTWTIDLKVPCFAGECAQDWASFVASINPNANPNTYIQPNSNEHQLFGCDIWLEVTGISLTENCKDKLDLMLVLDRSGSIDPTELGTLKTAAKAFVDALAPEADGAHMGQSSFSTTGSLDRHLTADPIAIKAAIDALSASGLTNLKEGIDKAKVELDNPGDGHDRADVDSKDFMVIITDGAPNRPFNETIAKATAITSANAAKAAGVTIYVVGVGTSASTSAYLRDNIATSPAHYFDATNYASLSGVLEELVICGD